MTENERAKGGREIRGREGKRESERGSEGGSDGEREGGREGVGCLWIETSPSINPSTHSPAACAHTRRPAAATDAHARTPGHTSTRR